ncbi:MAG: class I SAM-dependent methyltransferase, partial [Candidatus Woesearchaeota archaeon]|nr:class I SAM-dependent methyltransferase [Candidatus Woesearchaeota archaeon]
GFNTLGIDCSKEQIVSNTKSMPELLFKVQNVEQLEFKDESVDAFFMINVIHYVDRTNALNEIFRCLKKPGFFFVHFSLSITDSAGKIDYSETETDVENSVSQFKTIQKRIFERIDKTPVEHTHKIMELILQKV